MRHVLAAVVAVGLAASIAGSGLAAPPARVNRFVGDFDLVAWDLQRVVGHVVADITQPSASKLDPGSITIAWKDGREVRESHAQVIAVSFFESSWADPNSPTGYFKANEVLVDGWLCDYFGPSSGTCQPFAMIFQHILNGGEPTADKVGFSARGTTDCCNGEWWPAGTGAFVVTYARSADD